MSIKRVEADEAAELIEKGWILVDVRSEQEFEEGHPKGALNIPWMHKTPSGMKKNEDFEKVIKRHLQVNQELVLTCRSGNRSLKAANAMSEWGYTKMVDLRGGFSGEKDKSGQVTCKGWEAHELPVEKGLGEKTYQDLKSEV